MSRPATKLAAAVPPTEAPPAERQGRLSADDWAQAALDLIAETGVQAVAVEPLARRLGRFERDRLLVLWPLAALAGWLTVAAPLNLITTLTAFEALPAALPPSGWAITAIVVTSLVTLGVTSALRTLAYPLPVAWGLLGAFVAEQPDKPAVAFVALAGAIVVLIGGVLLAFRMTPGVDRPA